MNLDPIKVVKCKTCGVDVKVNANYPISEAIRLFRLMSVSKEFSSQIFKAISDLISSTDSHGRCL